MEPTIKEALEHEQIFMHNPTLRREYEAREKAVRDEISRIKTAREEGIKEEKIRQEKQQTQKQIVQLLHLMDCASVDLDQAMTMLGMSEEEKIKYRKLMNT